MMRGVSPSDPVGYAARRDLELARVYWPAAFRQTLLVGRLKTFHLKCSGATFREDPLMGK